MNGTTLDSPEVARYLDRVREALHDLPPDERDDLLADLEASLADSAHETLRRPPEEFAAELREAAGLGAVAAPPAADPLRALVARVADAWARRAGPLARELAPIWWVARAYAAVVAAALLLDAGWPLRDGGVGASAVALGAATVLSLWLGMRLRERRGTWIVAAANAALAIALAPAVTHSLDVAGTRVYYTQVVGEPTPGLALDGVPVHNLFPFSRDGELLQDVLLYDEAGRPVAIPASPDDTDRRLLLTPLGKPVLNSFPIRYYEPGTQWVARPRLAPRVELPRIATPPLDKQVLPAPTR